MSQFTKILLLAAATASIAAAVHAQTACYYRIGFRDGMDSDPDEEFIVMTRDPSVIAVAEDELSLPSDLRGRHVNGYREYDYGSGRYSFDGNTPANDWVWQFTPGNWVLAEMSIEICDGRPTTFDESNHFCPWLSYVKGHIIVAANFTAFSTQWQGLGDLLVEWTTMGEMASSHFEVQVTVSDEPEDFQTVATEPATGGPLILTDYQVLVSGLADGLNYVRVAAFDLNGHYVYSDVLGLDPSLDVPPSRGGFTLLPNHPNPFNPRTTIVFIAPDGGGVACLTIHDARGRLQQRLENGYQASGRHEITWDGRDERGRNLPSGAYFCCLVSGDERLVRKVSLLR